MITGAQINIIHWYLMKYTKKLEDGTYEIKAEYKPSTLVRIGTAVKALRVWVWIACNADYPSSSVKSFTDDSKVIQPESLYLAEDLKVFA